MRRMEQPDLTSDLGKPGGRGGASSTTSFAIRSEEAFLVERSGNAARAIGISVYPTIGRCGVDERCVVGVKGGMRVISPWGFQVSFLPRWGPDRRVGSLVRPAEWVQC